MPPSMGQIVDRAKLASGAALKERVSIPWINFSQKAPVYIYPAEPRYMLWKVLFFYYSPYGSET